MRTRRRRTRRHRTREVEGLARVDLRTKNLLHRLRPGEIAFIAHEDLDGVSAEGLVEAGAAAVVNVSRSMTGRYPNAGPSVLAGANIPLVDGVGEAVLRRVREGDRVRVRGAEVFVGDEPVASGTLLTAEVVERRLAEAHAVIGRELERFVRNTIEYLEAERDLVLRGDGVPAVRTDLEGRTVVVVVRGTEFRKDLRTLRPFIAEQRPILLAVDGAADALLEEGFRPDLIVGDMDSVSDRALACGAELVVHAYPDGRAPGMERVTQAGADAHLFRSAGTSEDIALLLAYERGADLIVAVGAHDNLVEFLDKGRGGMASTFVTRLKVGPKLVDAKGVNRLYRSQVRTYDMVVLVAAALIAMLVVASVTPVVRLFIRATVEWIKGLF